MDKAQNINGKCSYIYVKMCSVWKGVEICKSYMIVPDGKGCWVSRNFTEGNVHVGVKSLAQAMLLIVVPFSWLPNVCFSQWQYHYFKFLHQPLFPFLP